MVLEVLAIVISVISLIVSIFLGVIRYKEYIESKSKIKIDILSQQSRFRKRTEEDKEFMHNNKYANKMQIIPEKILTFDITFRVRKIGMKPKTIDKIYFYWKYPLFEHKHKDFGKYRLINNINIPYGIGEGFDQIEIKDIPATIKKHLEISSFLAFDLEHNMNKFKEENQRVFGKKAFQYDFMKDYINLPPKIILEIIIIDTEGKKTIKEIFFYPNIPHMINSP